MSIPAIVGSTIIPAATAATLAFVPSVLNPGVTSSINSNLGNTLSSLPQVPQYFFTVPFANNQAVLYKLELTPGSGTAGSVDTYIFPLTPNNVTKQIVNLTNYYDVNSNSNSNYGVQRIVDVFGLTPAIITISGSTGFQFHSLDNYQWSGKSSFAVLVSMIQSFSQQVASVIASGQNSSLPTMTFTDGFTGEQFKVVPFGQQGYAMDAARPIYQTYNLQFLATETVSPTPINIAQEDPIAQAFILGKAILTAGLLSWVNHFFSQLPGSNIQ